MHPTNEELAINTLLWKTLHNTAGKLTTITLVQPANTQNNWGTLWSMIQYTQKLNFKLINKFDYILG